MNNKKKMYYFVKNSLVKAKDSLDFKNNKILKSNIDMQNLFREERCFVLGNGPSLNLYDLSVLRNETVFCVNEFYRFDKYDVVNPNYYFIADPAYFGEHIQNNEGKDFINSISKLHDNVEVWMPIGFRKVIDGYGLQKSIKVRYFRGDIMPIDNKYEKIHFEKSIPGMQAVVQYAILLAIYMGFKEIYLLGTEQTDIFSYLNTCIKSEGEFNYAYSMDDSTRAWKTRMLFDYSLAETLMGYARIFELYEYLGRYCSHHGVRIFNCSPGSLIQGIPYMEFSTIPFIDK